MGENIVIHVNMDERCPRCHKRGTVNGGVCLLCLQKAILVGEFDGPAQPGDKPPVGETEGGENGA